MEIVNFESMGAKVTGYLYTDHPGLAAHKNRPALILCPGGSYQWLSPREMDSPALAYAAMGYHVFILHYGVEQQAGQLRPLHQLARTVCTLRENCEQWHIDPQKIAVLGFSAGGHLACSLGALWHREELHLSSQCRPDALVLCYPVITMGKFAHKESRENVTGGDAALEGLLSLEQQVTSAFPPVFVWHTVDDASVPVENTMLLCRALQEHKVPFECHLFAHGAHGSSTCTQEVETPNPACHAWLNLSQTWLNERFHFIP